MANDRLYEFNGQKGHWYTDDQGNRYFVAQGQTPKEGWEATKSRKMIKGGKYVKDDGDDKGEQEISANEYQTYEADEEERFDETTDADFEDDKPEDFDRDPLIDSEEDGTNGWKPSEEAEPAYDAGGFYSINEGDRWEYDGGGFVEVHNIAGENVEIATPSGTEWVTKDELSDMVKKAVKVPGKGKSQSDDRGPDESADWDNDESDSDSRKKILSQMENIREEEKQKEKNNIKEYVNDDITYDEFKKRQKQLHQETQARIDSLYDQLADESKNASNEDNKTPLHVRSLQEQISNNPDYKSIVDSIDFDKSDEGVSDAYFYAFKDAYEKTGYKPSPRDIENELSNNYYGLMNRIREGRGMSENEWDRYGYDDFEKKYGNEQEFIKKGMDAYNRTIQQRQNLAPNKPADNQGPQTANIDANVDTIAKEVASKFGEANVKVGENGHILLKDPEGFDPVAIADEDEIPAGAIVKIMPDWREPNENPDDTYFVKEDRGNRLLLWSPSKSSSFGGYTYEWPKNTMYVPPRMQRGNPASIEGKQGPVEKQGSDGDSQNEEGSENTINTAFDYLKKLYDDPKTRVSAIRKTVEKFPNATNYEIGRVMEKLIEYSKGKK